MYVDPVKARALRMPPISVDIERGRLRLFAKAIDQKDPIYTDPESAKLAGHPDLPVPPTFFFSLELEESDLAGHLAELGVDLRRILHGEQSFTYYSIAHAGESLTLQPKIVDVYTKKNGALEFLVIKTEVFRAGGQRVAEASKTIAIGHSEVTA